MFYAVYVYVYVYIHIFFLPGISICMSEVTCTMTLELRELNNLPVYLSSYMDFSLKILKYMASVFRATKFAPHEDVTSSRQNQQYVHFLFINQRLYGLWKVMNVIVSVISIYLCVHQMGG